MWPIVVFKSLQALKKFCKRILESYRAMVTSVHLYVAFQVHGELPNSHHIHSTGLQFEDMLSTIKDFRITQIYVCE